MPNRILNVFGSYDFYGKALPGIVFSVGVLTLFPNSDSLPLSPDLASYAFFLLLITLVGTLIGEAVHSLGIYIESLIAWVGRRLFNIFTSNPSDDENWYQRYLNSEEPDKDEQAVKISRKIR